MKNQIKILCLSIVSCFVIADSAFGQAGIVFPSFSTEERDAIKVEAGHTIFNSTTQTINVFNGKKWKEYNGEGQLKANGVPTKIENASGSARIETFNNDVIRFRSTGSERLSIYNHMIIPKNNGFSVFLGDGAGVNDDLSSNRNVFVGEQAGTSNISGHSNTFLGSLCGVSNNTGTRNIYIGLGSGSNNTSGNLNVKIGNSAGSANVSGSDNVMLGAFSGFINTGSRNVFLGYRAGYNEKNSNKLYIANSNTHKPLIYGDFSTKKLAVNGNMSIGSHYGTDELYIYDNNNDGDAVTRLKTTSGEVNLGFNLPSQGIVGTQSNHDFRIRTNGTTRMAIKPNGNIGIGTNAPSQKLHVTGNICATGSIASCSDIRYKESFQNITHALSKVTQLNGLYYNWKNDEFPNKEFTEDRQIGVIAQEVEALFPEMVLTDSEGYKSVDYARLTPVLIEALKELKNDFENKLNTQELEFNNKLNILESRIDKILNNN